MRPLLNELSDPSAIHANSYISSKLYPLAGQSTGHVQWCADAPASAPGERLPIPPMHLWEGYASTPEEYLKSGQHQGWSFSGGTHQGTGLRLCRREDASLLPSS
jgi:hypothetical protein